MESALHVCAGMSQDGSSLTESWAGPGNDVSSSVASRLCDRFICHMTDANTEGNLEFLLLRYYSDSDNFCMISSKLFLCVCVL